MNAIKFLLKEHAHVRRTFSEIAKKSHRTQTKQKKLDLLCKELLVHEKMEEVLWYPYLEENKEFRRIIKHLIKEEKKAEKIIKEILKGVSDKKWEGKFDRLKKDVEHHAREEERRLFPRVKKFFPEKELKKLGRDMKNFKSKKMQKQTTRNNAWTFF